MNEELQKRLNESAISIIESIEKGVNWASGQTPIVVQELLGVYIFDAWFSLIITVFLAVGLLIIGIKFFKFFMQKHKSSYTGNDYDVAAWLLGGIFIIVSCVSFVLIAPIHVRKLYKGYNAPRVVAIEQIKEII